MNYKKKHLLLCCYTGNVEGKAVIDRVMTSVKGGTLQAAAAMRAKLDKDGLMDLQTYENWAASIPDVPALMYSEVGMTDQLSAMLEAWES